MVRLAHFIDDRLAAGRAYFSREEALARGISPSTFATATTRLIEQGKLARPRHGFYLIVRPEERAAGASDPAQWIEPLMKQQGLDYRVSLLRAAAFHGSSHQAAMVFQVVAPQQLRELTLGRHRLQFVYQEPRAFASCNQAELLDTMKTQAGFAKVAGVELTLLDCVRYMHRVGGINGVAQIAKDIGRSADPRKLARAASNYEGASARRLGFLLERAGRARQAGVLETFADKAKSFVPLDPAVKPLAAALTDTPDRDAKWKLDLNEAIEVDA